MEVDHRNHSKHQHIFLLRSASIDDSDCVQDPRFVASSLLRSDNSTRSESPFSHVVTSPQLDTQANDDD
jgi:hypothetical protein